MSETYQTQQADKAQDIQAPSDGDEAATQAAQTVPIEPIRTSGGMNVVYTGIPTAFAICFADSIKAWLSSANSPKLWHLELPSKAQLHEGRRRRVGRVVTLRRIVISMANVIEISMPDEAHRMAVREWLSGD